ncbi:MAG: YraN family protein [Bacteroidales bacterium]|nr:YraN family protein [Bacteroidales bacterium]
MQSTPEQRRQANELGTTGEQMATRYLEGLHYTIIERNYRCGKYEADIIALDGDELVVVEVKTRSSTDFGTPQEAVDHRKRARLIRAASHYIGTHNRQENTRFDVVAIVPGEGGFSINHIKDAFNVMNY